MKKTLGTFAAALAVAVLAGCANQKEPADAALKTAEQALANVKAEAEKLAPEALAAADSALGGAKDKFTKGDYAGVLAEVPAVTAKIAEVAKAVAAKKDELTKAWADLSGSLPAAVEAVKTKLADLAKAKKLSKELDAAKVDAAKAAVEEISKGWTEASDAFGKGDLSGAVSKAGAIKAKVAEVSQALGIAAAPAPAAASAAK